MQCMIYNKQIAINSCAQDTHKYKTKQKVNSEGWVQGNLTVKTDLEVPLIYKIS